MVAVGSKSIPEKQSISLNLSKETEDNLNTELFSEIFSSESINNDSIPESKSVTDNDKIDFESACLSPLYRYFFLNSCPY